MSSEDRTFTNLIFHAGTDSQVRCSTYADSTPILTLDGGPTSVMISTTRRTVTPEGVEFARALVKHAQRYAAEMERLFAEQSGDIGKADTKAA